MTDQPIRDDTPGTDTDTSHSLATDVEPAPPPRLDVAVAPPTRRPRTGRGMGTLLAVSLLSAVLASTGTATAINTAVATSAEGLGFAIPIAAAADLLDLAGAGSTI